MRTVSSSLKSVLLTGATLTPCSDVEQVAEVVRAEKPDLLFTASMWTPEQSAEIQQTAKDIVGPQLKTFALPQGLQVERGPDAVVDYIKENLPTLLEAR